MNRSLPTMKRKQEQGDLKSNKNKRSKSSTPIASLPVDLLNYIFKLAQLNSEQKFFPTRIPEVCKFWNQEYSKSALGKFQKIVSQAIKSLRDLEKNSKDFASELERIFVIGGEWLEICNENIIPKLENLADANNIYAQLLLYKIYCEKKLCKDDLSSNLKISIIEDYKITPKSDNSNFTKGYNYLTRAAAQDSNAKELLIKVNGLINEQKNLATCSDNMSEDDLQDYLKMEV